MTPDFSRCSIGKKASNLLSANILFGSTRKKSETERKRNGARQSSGGTVKLHRLVAADRRLKRWVDAVCGRTVGLIRWDVVK